MKSKIFTLIIAMAMMLSFIGVASATDSCPYSCGCECDGGILECTCNEGLCPCNPIELLYVFADWDGWPFDTYPDLNTAGIQTYTIGSNTYYINVTSMEGYEDDSYWSEPSAEFLAAASDDYEDFDIIFVDMVNMYMGEFETGAYNAAVNEKLLTAIRTGPNNNTCYMPLGFSIRDTGDYTYAYSGSSIVATANTNKSAVLVNNTSNPYYTADSGVFANKFFKIHDSPDPGAAGSMNVADNVHSDAMAKLLIAKYLGLSLPTFSLNP